MRSPRPSPIDTGPEGTPKSPKSANASPKTPKSEAASPKTPKVEAVSPKTPKSEAKSPKSATASPKSPGLKRSGSRDLKSPSGSDAELGATSITPRSEGSGDSGKSSRSGRSSRKAKERSGSPKSGDGAPPRPVPPVILGRPKPKGLAALAELSQDDLRKLFVDFDTDRSGEMSREELFGFLESYTGIKPSQQAMKAVLEGIDANNSGSIDIDEFVQFFVQLQVLEETQHELEFGEQKAGVRSTILLGYIGLNFVAFCGFLIIMVKSQGDKQEAAKEAATPGLRGAGLQGQVGDPQQRHVGAQDPSTHGTGAVRRDPNKPEISAEASANFGEIGLFLSGAALLLAVVVGVLVPIARYKLSQAGVDVAAGWIFKHARSTTSRIRKSLGGGALDDEDTSERPRGSLGGNPASNSLQALKPTTSHSTPVGILSAPKPVTTYANPGDAPADLWATPARPRGGTGSPSGDPSGSVGLSDPDRPRNTSRRQTLALGMAKLLGGQRLSEKSKEKRYDPRRYIQAKSMMEEEDARSPVRTGGFNPLVSQHTTGELHTRSIFIERPPQQTGALGPNKCLNNWPVPETEPVSFVPASAYQPVEPGHFARLKPAENKEHSAGRGMTSMDFRFRKAQMEADAANRPVQAWTQRPPGYGHLPGRNPSQKKEKKERKEKKEKKEKEFRKPYRSPREVLKREQEREDRYRSPRDEPHAIKKKRIRDQESWDHHKLGASGIPTHKHVAGDVQKVYSPRYAPKLWKPDSDDQVATMKSAMDDLRTEHAWRDKRAVHDVKSHPEKYQIETDPNAVRLPGMVGDGQPKPTKDSMDSMD